MRTAAHARPSRSSSTAVAWAPMCPDRAVSFGPGGCVMGRSSAPAACETIGNDPESRGLHPYGPRFRGEASVTNGAGTTTCGAGATTQGVLMALIGLLLLAGAI